MAINMTADFNESTGSRKRRKTSVSPKEEVSDSDSDAASSQESSQEDEEEENEAEPSSNGDPKRPMPATIAEAKDVAALQIPTSFATLGVSPWLVASLSAMQVKRPTAIQAACIPQIMRGADCLGGSRTGSGKTLAFAVPILQQWAVDPRGIYALILTPTRELALQIHEQLLAIGAPQQLKPLLITGGADQTAQALGLARNPHIVVATPGRLADLIRTAGAETTAGLRRAAFLVLDEADRLLEPGHGSMLPDVEECLAALPPASMRQTCLFTATVTDEVRALRDRPRAEGRLPVFVAELDASVQRASGTTTTTTTTTKTTTTTSNTDIKPDVEAQAAAKPPPRILPSTLRQTYLLAPLSQRESYLHTLLTLPTLQKAQAIIFTNRTATAAVLSRTLQLLGHRVAALYGTLPQRERTAALGRFRAGAARLLVATDVAARGLDVPRVALVVNFDVPRDPDDYVHRVGRTARAGREGLAVTIVGQRDVDLVLAVEERVGAKMGVFEERGEDGAVVDFERRVVSEGVKIVGEKKREAMLQIEMGLDAGGKNKARKLRPV